MPQEPPKEYPRAETKRFTRPSYAVSIGSDSFSSTNGREVISIRVVRNMGLPIDFCEAFLVEGAYSFSKDDKMTVQLGYDETLLPVFSGYVDKIDYLMSKVGVSALGLLVSLLRLRLSRVYLNQNAGKIASNLAQEANLTVGKASPGFNMPMYVVDDTANTYQHILRLAEHCNFDAYIADDEKFLFKEWSGGMKHSIEYGKEVIRLEGSDVSQPFVSARIYGESPASVKGSDTSHWLTKKEVKGEVGTGRYFDVFDPAIRDKKTADSVASAELSRLQHAFTALVETVGKPEVKLGDTVTLSGVPNVAFGGELQVRSVEHYVSKSRGFTTRIRCRR